MMNKREIFRKIGSIIVEINEQYQYLSDNPEMLNDLELELFSANADFLAEHVKVLKKVNLAEQPQPEMSVDPSGDDFAKEQVKVPDEPQVSTEEKEFAPPPAELSSGAAEKSSVSLPAVETAVPAFNERPASAPPEEQAAREQAPAMETEQGGSAIQDSRLPESPVLEDRESRTTEPAPATIKEEEDLVIREVVIPEKVTNIPVSEPSQAERPQQTEQNSMYTAPVNAVQSVVPPAAPTLNDIISAQKAASATPVSSALPISDLKSAINLNDKLLFIKDLFNGYSLAYSEAIEIVNRFDTFDAADQFLKSNYASKNNWSARQSTVDKFYELLHRRFPAA